MVIDGRRSTIELLAEGVTLEGLTLRNVQVAADNEFEFRTGPCVVDNVWEGDARLSLRLVRACRVEGNTLEVTPRTGPAIDLFRTVGCRVARNTLAGGVERPQIEDLQSGDMHVDDNRLTGRIESRQRSGQIRGNVLTGDQGIDVDPRGPSEAAPPGHLRIADNTAPWISVVRTDVAVVGNTVRADPAGRRARPLISVHNFEPAGARGVVLVEGNIVRGGRTGIVLTSHRRGSPAPALVRHNSVADCTRAGIVVNRGATAQVVENTCERCGEGTGVGVRIAGTTGHGVVAARNTVVGTRGDGMAVVRPGGRVTLHANVVRCSSGDGLDVHRERIDEGAEGDGEGGEDGRTLAVDNVLVENGGAGARIRTGARASSVGGEIAGNGEAGVFVGANALAAVSRVRMHGNAAPGIDVAPAGVTPNPMTKRGNLDLDWPEGLRWLADRLEAMAAPERLVEIFAVAAGPRLGNPQNGEGVEFLGSAVADSAGRWVFPLPCTPGTILTTTATLPADQPPTAPGRRPGRSPARSPPAGRSSRAPDARAAIWSGSPSVTGLIYAVESLRAAGLEVGQVTYAVGFQAGFVLRQGQPFDALVLAGTPIDLEVAYQEL